MPFLNSQICDENLDAAFDGLTAFVALKVSTVPLHVHRHGAYRRRDNDGKKRLLKDKQYKEQCT